MCICLCIYDNSIYTHTYTYIHFVLQRKPSRHIQKTKVLYNLVIHKLLIGQGDLNVIFYNQHL